MLGTDNSQNLERFMKILSQKFIFKAKHSMNHEDFRLGMGDNKNFMSRYIIRVIMMIINIIMISLQALKL